MTAPSHRFTRLTLALLLALVGSPVPADAEPRAFTARYSLAVGGWPEASIEHRLSREGGHWQSRMQASLAMARGDERSRFRVTPDGVQGLGYRSGYSLLGIGKDYRLAADRLTGLPDRQAALFALSRRATGGDCQAGCEVGYLDHQGEEQRLEVRPLAGRRLSLPAGEFTATRIELTDPDEPDRRLVLAFDADTPGLLLGMAYHRDGERRGRLTLTDLDRED
jgi:hypothetical protein